jgi:hypothetical protein
MTVMLIKRAVSLRSARLWLPLACVIFSFFSFASMACAAQCAGADCVQVADDSAPTNSGDTQNLDIMIAGGCMLCCNIIVDQIALTGVPPLHPPLYAAALCQQSSRHIAPDIPPPRSFERF